MSRGRIQIVSVRFLCVPQRLMSWKGRDGSFWLHCSVYHQDLISLNSFGESLKDESYNLVVTNMRYLKNQVAF